jgi:proline iminopeptidase
LTGAKARRNAVTLSFRARTFRRVAFVAALAVAGAASADTSPKTFTRDRAAAIIANARKIVTPHGIERLEKVRIGGIDQWVSIRGSDTRNPVLLYVHGGPGYISMPMSWWWHGWEDYFTVVNWDQRGAGKTYLLNDPAKVGPTITPERMIADTEEMTNWLRKTLGKKKIFLLGHSAGSYWGLEMALRHPDWLHAYIGVAQITNGPESERRGWQATLNAARRDGNAKAVRDLEAMAPYPPKGRPLTLEEIYAERKWLDYYGGVMAYRHGNDAEGDLADLSPDYTDAEIPLIWKGNRFTESHLLPWLLGQDLSGNLKFDCPIIIFAGRHDVDVNAALTREWFEKVQAPSKQFVRFEHSSHLPMTEEPGKFLVSLVRYARPIAERAGDVAPEGPDQPAPR